MAQRHHAAARCSRSCCSASPAARSAAGSCSTASPTAPSRSRTGCFPGLVIAALAGSRWCSAARRRGRSSRRSAIALAGRVPARSAATRRSRSWSRRWSGSARCSRSRPTRRPASRSCCSATCSASTSGDLLLAAALAAVVLARAAARCTAGCWPSASTARSARALGAAPRAVDAAAAGAARRSRCSSRCRRSAACSCSRCWSAPAATARLLTRRLVPMMALAVGARDRRRVARASTSPTTRASRPARRSPALLVAGYLLARLVAATSRIRKGAGAAGG